MQQLNADPLFQAKCRIGLKKVQATPEWKEKNRIQNQSKSTNQDYRIVLNIAMQKRSANQSWQIAHRQRLHKKNSDIEFQKARLEGIRRRNTTQEYILKMKEVGRIIGLKSSDISRTVLWKSNKYHSAAEAAVADLLSSYIPSYKPIKGETWQVRDKGINNGGIDFLVETASERRFIEYHPPKHYKNKSGGDFKDGKEYNKFLTIKNRLELDKGIEYSRRFVQRIKDMLTRKYTQAREAAIAGSEYAGTPLIVCTTPQEIYTKVIAPYTTQVVSEQQFIQEYRAIHRAILDAQKIYGPHMVRDKAA